MSILILKRDGVVGLLKVLFVLALIGAALVTTIYGLIYANNNFSGGVNSIIWIILIVAFIAYSVYKTVTNKEKARIGFKTFC